MRHDVLKHICNVGGLLDKRGNETNHILFNLDHSLDFDEVKNGLALFLHLFEHMLGIEGIEVAEVLEHLIQDETKIVPHREGDALVDLEKERQDLQVGLLQQNGTVLLCRVYDEIPCVERVG